MQFLVLLMTLMVAFTSALPVVISPIPFAARSTDDVAMIAREAASFTVGGDYKRGVAMAIAARGVSTKGGIDYKRETDGVLVVRDAEASKSTKGGTVYMRSAEAEAEASKSTKGGTVYVRSAEAEAEASKSTKGGTVYVRSAEAEASKSTKGGTVYMRSAEAEAEASKSTKGGVTYKRAAIASEGSF